MLTVFDLCNKMTDSGRPISPRTLRSWWTRRLLPSPARKWLGQGFGSESFWTQKSILIQAQTTYDLFRRPGRRVSAEDVIVQLWILGFKIPTAAVREALIKRLHRHDLKIGLHDDDREEFVSKLAVSTAKYMGRAHGAPNSVKDAITDVCLEILSLFYRTGEEDTFDQLGNLWEQAAPYFSKTSESDSKRKVIPFEEILTMMPFIKQSATLRAQIGAVDAATEYELVTMQRVVQLIFAFFRQTNRVSSEIDLASMKDLCEPMIFGLIPSLLPILVSAVRNHSIRSQIVWIVFEGLSMLRGDARQT